MQFIRPSGLGIWLFSWVGIHLCAYSQEVDSVTYLEEVDVFGVPISEYINDASYKPVDSVYLRFFNTQSLGALLQESTGIYLREYGAEGQLATVSMRGTTPAQMAIQWNGVDITSQSLGQIDFSSIPAFMLTVADLLKGGNSAIMGSGAIGGGINVQSFGLNTNHSANVLMSIGSFGKQAIGVGFQEKIGATKFYGKIYYTSFQNDFEVNFRNESYRQNNAEGKQFTISAGSRTNLTPTTNIGFEAWYSAFDRNIQPIIGDLNSDDQIYDRNIRLQGFMEYAKRQHYAKTSLSFLSDHQVFNDGQPFNIDRWVLNSSYDVSLKEQLTVQFGGNLSLALTNTANYVSDTSQLKGGLHTLVSFKKFKNLELLLNLRKPFVQGIETPFLPKQTIRYTLLNREKAEMTMFTTISRDFRAPTLNDLFWNPGGNPALLPERSINMELGIDQKFNFSPITLELEGSLYRNSINNMIVWLPGGMRELPNGELESFWSPENIQEVQVDGIEGLLKASYKSGNLKTKLSLFYNYNRSINRSPLSSVDRSKGKQLPYVPLHAASATFNLGFRKSSFTYIHSYTGQRFTESTNEMSLDAFGLASFEINHRLSLMGVEVIAGFQVRNLWNKDYFNYELRATPGRNYHVSINLNF